MTTIAGAPIEQTAVRETEKTTAPEKRKALGRGLESLLPSGPRMVAGSAAGVSPAAHSIVLPDLQAQAAQATASDTVLQIPLDQIDKNPHQTRLDFDQAALQELAESVRANGLIQPVVVRPGQDGRYVLILGERRCRAAKLADRTSIPAIVRTVSDQQAAEMTIVENLQRQDLNCLEQANAFARLSRDFRLTQEQIGQRTGCSRESVSNYLRLLKLPPEVQQYLAVGELGFSEARVLLQLANPQSILYVAKDAVEKKLSVAQLTAIVDRANLPAQAFAEPTGGARWQDPNVREAQAELQRILGVRVRIADRKGKGKIVIEYASLEDYDRVLGMLKGKS